MLIKLESTPLMLDDASGSELLLLSAGIEVVWKPFCACVLDAAAMKSYAEQGASLLPSDTDWGSEVLSLADGGAVLLGLLSTSTESDAACPGLLSVKALL